MMVPFYDAVLAPLDLTATINPILKIRRARSGSELANAGHSSLSENQLTVCRRRGAMAYRSALPLIQGLLSTKLGMPQLNMADWTRVPRASGRNTLTTSIRPIAAIRRVISSVLCMPTSCGSKSKLAASSLREVHRNYVHRTRHYPRGKMYYAEMERIMSYQWDASKARRTRLFRLGCVIVATAASAAMPVYILVEAMRP